MANPQQVDPFIVFRQDASYKFRKFRHEGRVPTTAELQAHGRPLLLQLPKRGWFRGLRDPHRRPRYRPYREQPNPLGLGDPRNRHLARPARLRLQLRLAPYRLRLERTLGWGGNGIASLFSLLQTDPQGQQVREYFVAKCSLRQTQSAIDAMKQEKSWQQRYRGALHIVQTKRFPPPLNPDHAAQHHLGDILFLEYLIRGNLHKVLCGLTQWQPARSIPNRVLWWMFQCLVQACIGLEYAPLHDWQFGPSIDSNGRLPNGEPFSERVPPDPPNPPPPPPAADGHGVWPWNIHTCNEGPSSLYGSGLVHLDIEPHNIFLGGHNIGPSSDDHDHAPVLQLGDFGSARRVDNFTLHDRRKMWETRSLGKSDYWTPEQFTEEWDWVEGCPIRENPRPKTAGKYSWNTNLYQFGLVMASAITLCRPPKPPINGKIKIPDPANPNRKITIWSYGAYLLNRRFSRVGIKLRRLVAQCLCDEPAHRPDPGELKRTIADHLQNQNWTGEDDNMTLFQWVGQNMPILAPLATHWVDASLL